jgi:hypothetical protein
MRSSKCSSKGISLAGLFDDADAGEDQELGVAAKTELLFVGILGAAGLAVHQESCEL